MMTMLRRSNFRLCALLAGFGLVFLSLTAGAQQDSSYRGRKYKAPPPTARVTVTVMRAFNGKPLENAAVIFHAMEGEKDTGNMELKTDEDGKSIIDVMPIGDTMRLQIIASGYQTFGGDYKIDKPEMAIKIRLKRPGQQYSIYDNHPEATGAGQTPDAVSAPASKDKPTTEPDEQSSPSQPQPK
jgi:hypothetical protein